MWKAVKRKPEPVDHTGNENMRVDGGKALAKKLGNGGFIGAAEVGIHKRLG